MTSYEDVNFGVFLKTGNYYRQVFLNLPQTHSWQRFHSDARIL